MSSRVPPCPRPAPMSRRPVGPPKFATLPADVYAMSVTRRTRPDLHSPMSPHRLPAQGRHDSGPRPAFVWVEMATSRHSLRQPGCRGDRRRIATPDQASGRPIISRDSPEPGAWASKAKTVGSEPRTGHLMREASSEMTEAQVRPTSRRRSEADATAEGESTGMRRRDLRLAWRRDPSSNRTGSPLREDELPETVSPENRQEGNR